MCRGGWSSPWLLLSPDILPVLTSYQCLGPRSPPLSLSHIQDQNEGAPKPLELPGSYPHAPRPCRGGWGFHVAAFLGCGDPLCPPRVPPLATGLGVFPLLSRTGIHQPRTETILSEATWVTWLDLGLKMQARIFQGTRGTGWPGVVWSPFSEGKAWSCRTFVPSLVTHVISLLDTFMRPESPPSGHPTWQFSKTTASLKDGFAATACVRGRHFLSCASVFQADGRGGARVGGVPGELPGGLTCAPFLESADPETFPVLSGVYRPPSQALASVSTPAGIVSGLAELASWSS